MQSQNCLGWFFYCVHVHTRIYPHIFLNIYCHYQNESDAFFSKYEDLHLSKEDKTHESPMFVDYLQESFVSELLTVYLFQEHYWQKTDGLYSYLFINFYKPRNFKLILSSFCIFWEMQFTIFLMKNI